MNRYELTSPQKLIYQSESTVGKEASLIQGIMIFNKENDIDRFEKSVRKVLNKIDVFKVKFIEIDKGIRQEFKDFDEDSIETLYFNSIEEAKEYAKNDFNIGINENLYKFSIMKIGDDKLGFLLSVDHIIADAWSGLNIVNFIIEDFYGELDIESIGSYEDYIN